MKIDLSFCVSQKKLNFKNINNEWNIVGFDEAGKPIRNYIREHYEKWHTPTIDIYEKEKKLDEYSLKQRLNQLLNHNKIELNNESLISNKVNKIDDKIMKSLPLYNLSKLKNMESYRGQTLSECSNDVLECVKKAGIKTIIDLVGYSNYKEKVNQYGLDYISFNMERLYDYIFPFSLRKFDKKEEQNIKNEFIKFINKMQQDNIYIGCEYGSYKTDDALFLNNLFNPKKLFNNQMRRGVFRPSILNMSHIAKFYNKLNLTEEDKRALKWTKEFEKSFIEKIKTFNR